MAEQKGIPLVINIAAAPPITEQGYKFVFRNFPTAPMILGDAFGNQKEMFAAAGSAPKSVVFMHVNDTFGTAMQKGIDGVMPKFDMPYKIVETIAYDPAARDLSVELAKAKATGAEALLVVSRLNDAMLLTRELVKQRWTPMAVLSMGPGWYEDQYLKTLGKLSDGPLSFVPWYDPNKKLSKQLEAALAKAHAGINLNTNHIYTFEALLIAADAYKRAGSTDPKALADAIRATNITDNVSIGPGIKFDAKGQNTALKNAAIQNRDGKLVTVAPKAVGQRQGRVADDGLRQARLSLPQTPSAPAAEAAGASRPADRPGARGHLSQRRRQRPADRARLRADGARAVGDLRRGARRQLRPRRDDDDRHVHCDRAVLGLPARSAGHAGADLGGAVRARLRHAARADQPLHQPPRAQPVHAAGGRRADHGQRAADRVRPRRAERADVLFLRKLPVGRA